MTTTTKRTATKQKPWRSRLASYAKKAADALRREPPRIETYKFFSTEQFLPFPLPDAKSGKFKIEHEDFPVGEKLTVVSMRNAIFMGLRPADLLLERPTRVHYLREEGHGGGCWMSTMPQELEQAQRQLARAHGHVLVGGLGLGLAVALLAKNPRVSKITCIEISQDVIDLIQPHLLWSPRDNKPVAIVKDDLMEFLKRVQKLKAAGRGHAKFDFAFFDIWCPTGERIFDEQVLPLRRLAEGIIPQSEIECWNEDEMIGQIRLGCENWITPMPIFNGKPLVDMPQDAFDGYVKHNATVAPFARWARAKRPDHDHGARMADDYCAALKDPAKLDSRSNNFGNTGGGWGKWKE